MSSEKIRGRRVVLSVSGGKDSAAASLYLRELGIEHDRVFADTGWEHPKTYDYLRGPLTKMLGPIHEVRAEKLFADLVRQKRITLDAYSSGIANLSSGGDTCGRHDSFYAYTGEDEDDDNEETLES